MKRHETAEPWSVQTSGKKGGFFTMWFAFRHFRYTPGNKRNWKNGPWMKMYYIVLAIEHWTWEVSPMLVYTIQSTETSKAQQTELAAWTIAMSDPTNPDTPPRFGVTTVSNGSEFHLYKWTTNSGWCRHQVRFSMSLSMDRHMLACSESTTMWVKMLRGV